MSKRCDICYMPDSEPVVAGAVIIRLGPPSTKTARESPVVELGICESCSAALKGATHATLRNCLDLALLRIVSDVKYRRQTT